MKYLVLPVLLMITFAASAQPLTDRSRHVSPAVQAPTNWDALLSRKEAELNRLQVSYASLSTEGKEAARDQMQDLLYDIFDVSLQQKQWEARALRDKLDQAETDPSHRAQRDVLDSLRQTLQQVEAQLQFREENRDRIVIQRLHELI